MTDPHTAWTWLPLTDDPGLTSALTRARIAAGHTQLSLATELGCTVQMVSAVEQGRRGPSRQTVARWAQACGLTARIVLSPAS